MPPLPLASPADAVRLGYTLPSGREMEFLARASARLRRDAGRPISSTTSTVRLRVEGGKVMLPGGPVTAVSTVVRLPEDGGATLTGWRWDGMEHIHCIPLWCADVLVTYTHGLATIPDELLDLVCSVAVRLGQTEEAPGMEVGKRSESIDDYAVTYAVEAIETASGLLPGESQQLAAFLGSSPGAYVVRPR
ncbi:hypothetical protein [Nonomuraea typhae]|uniref:hypothetical protein n=1 Tax=Nonomuraea typhae TaxID=2603600 RepID=UPI0012F810C4|nr:hypothetical protein [Nonomuraea typhae]